MIVTTDDGVALHVEEDGDPQAPLAVVFVHGFTARLGEFDLQRAALRSHARLVLYDQRGHGRSGWGDVRDATIDRTGRDLGTVLDAAVPHGPVILVGHSMGGMSVMALARQRPQLFGPRVVGVFLLATSAADVVDRGAVGRIVAALTRLHLLRLYLSLLRLVAPLLERVRRRGTTLGRAYVRHLLFGRDDADPLLVREVQRMLEETPLTIAAAFYPTFVAHDEMAALAVLRRVPVTVVVGSDDRLAPARNSRRIAAEIGPTARLIVVPGAGHSVNVTRPGIVDTALVDLVETARPAA